MIRMSSKYFCGLRCVLSFLQRLVSAAFSERCARLPQVAECSLNAACVVKLLEMFLHVEHLGFYICILSVDLHI